MGGCVSRGGGMGVGGRVPNILLVPKFLKRNTISEHFSCIHRSGREGGQEKLKRLCRKTCAAYFGTRHLFASLDSTFLPLQ